MDGFSEPKSIGERIKRRREYLGFTKEDIAGMVQIPLRFLEAFEHDRFEDLPARVYARGFFLKLCGALSLPEKEELIRQFDAEWNIRTAGNAPENIVLPEAYRLRWFVTPKRLWFGLGGLFLLFFFLFLGSRITDFTGAPSLTIDEPQDRMVVHEPGITVKGGTEKESKLTVNGRELTIDGSGNFYEKIELVSGLNELEFIVENRFGKRTVEIRYVVVE